MTDRTDIILYDMLEHADKIKIPYPLTDDMCICVLGYLIGYIGGRSGHAD